MFFVPSTLKYPKKGWRGERRGAEEMGMSFRIFSSALSFKVLLNFSADNLPHLTRYVSHFYGGMGNSHALGHFPILVPESLLL